MSATTMTRRMEFFRSTNALSGKRALPSEQRLRRAIRCFPQRYQQKRQRFAHNACAQQSGVSRSER